jgi:hypothetical protein
MLLLLRRFFIAKFKGGLDRWCKLARTDGDSSPGSICSEMSVADDATDEVLFFRIIGKSLVGVCGRAPSG